MNGDLATVRGKGADRRQFVDQAWHFLRPDVERPGAVGLDGYRAARLARLVAGDIDLDAGAEAAQHAQERRTRRIQPHVVDRDT